MALIQVITRVNKDSSILKYPPTTNSLTIIMNLIPRVGSLVSWLMLFIGTHPFSHILLQHQSFLLLESPRQNLVGKWCHNSASSLIHTLDPNPSVIWLGPNLYPRPRNSEILPPSLVRRIGNFKNPINKFL